MRLEACNADEAKLKSDDNFEMRNHDLNHNYGNHIGWFDHNGHSLFN